MQQETRERDNQLRTQLQLRDEYFDAELKKMEHNSEDALKKNNAVRAIKEFPLAIR